MINARFKPISNQSDWSTACVINDRATGTPIDLTNIVTITLAVQMINQPNNPILTGSLTTGEITKPSLGIIQIYFPATRMQALTPGSYQVGMILADAVPRTVELFLGLLPVVA